MPKIRTVLGDIEPSLLGITHSHEHLLIDLWNIVGTYGAIVDEEDLIVAELKRFHDAGGCVLVDCTNVGIGRNPLAIQRISKTTGVHVVMGSGWYREKVCPACVFRKSPDQLAAVIAKDIEEGTDGTGVKAGVIGEIGAERYYITPAQERMFRVAARAHHRIGAPVVTNTTHFGELAMEQIALLKEEGVKADRICISHVGERHSIEDLLPIADTGAYLSVDHVGYTEFGSDASQADNVAAMVARGYAGQMMLGQDICRMSMLHATGGAGYDHLLRRFVPMLQERGVAQSAISAMLADNPARFLAF